MGFGSDSIIYALGSGGVGLYAVKRLIDWAGASKQEKTLYALEVEAHQHTRERLEAEITIERSLRKDAEMELTNTRKEHDLDRAAWRAAQDADHALREQLKDEVANLTRKVSALEYTIQHMQK